VLHDPVLAAMDRAAGPLTTWLRAVESYASYGKPTLAEVKELGSAVERARSEVKRIALEQPDWGSEQRYFET
jgi:hypothetical protein